MDETALLQNYLFVGAALFVLGMLGLLCRRNMIVMFLSAEMMLQGVSLSLVAWGRYHNDWGGQVLTIFILTVAACEAAVALALVMTLFHANGKLDMVAWQSIREDNQPAYVDQEVPEPVEVPHKAWPRLTPAGVDPVLPETEVLYRSQV
jgi:NADH-quinone oxidoreductase subunit K